MGGKIGKLMSSLGGKKGAEPQTRDDGRARTSSVNSYPKVCGGAMVASNRDMGVLIGLPHFY